MVLAGLAGPLGWAWTVKICVSERNLLLRRHSGSIDILLGY